MKIFNQKHVVATSIICITLLLLSKGLMFTSDANAYNEAVSNSNIIVTPVQLGNDIYGLAMVDTITERMWVYELSRSSSAHNRLKLIAARNWKYDKLLDQFNTGEPTPEQVRKLIEKAASPSTEQTTDNSSKK